MLNWAWMARKLPNRTRGCFRTSSRRKRWIPEGAIVDCRISAINCRREWEVWGASKVWKVSRALSRLILVPDNKLLYKTLLVVFLHRLEMPTIRWCCRRVCSLLWYLSGRFSWLSISLKFGPRRFLVHIIWNTMSQESSLAIKNQRNWPCNLGKQSPNLETCQE